MPQTEMHVGGAAAASAWGGVADVGDPVIGSHNLPVNHTLVNHVIVGGVPAVRVVDHEHVSAPAGNEPHGPSGRGTHVTISPGEVNRVAGPCTAELVRPIA